MSGIPGDDGVFDEPSARETELRNEVIREWLDGREPEACAECGLIGDQNSALADWDEDFRLWLHVSCVDAYRVNALLCTRTRKRQWAAAHRASIVEEDSL